MKWIYLSIKCHNDSEKVAELRELGIETEATTEYRKLRLRKDYIVGVYPNTENGCFIFVINGDELTVKESFTEVNNLIDD